MSIEMLDGKRVKRIWVIPYSHHDYAWVCFRSWHIQRYIKGFTEAAEMIEKVPGFTWLVDNVHHSWEPLEKYCPEEAQKVADHVKDGGTDVVDGGFGLARPSQVSEETYIRNLMAGRRFFQERFGIQDIPTLYNADTACGHSQLPQIAKLSGHRYYRFQRSDALLTAKGIPLQFNWKGLDGSEVLVARGLYGAMWCENEWLEMDYDTQWEQIRQRFYETCLKDKLLEDHPTEDVILFIGSDDCRPLRDRTDRPIKVVEFIEAWNQREPVKMAFTTLNKAFAELSQQEMPTYEGVLDHAELTYNFPFKADESMWRMRLEYDQLLVRLERTATMAAELGWTYPEKEIAECWRAMYEITGHAIEATMARDYFTLYELALCGRKKAAKLLAEAEDYIARTIPHVEEMQTVLINPLPTALEQVVRLDASTFDGVGGFDVYDHAGNKYDFQVVDVHDGYSVHEGRDHVSVEILVKVTVPATGVTGLYLVPNGGSLKEVVEKTFIDNVPSCLPEDCGDRVEFDNGKLNAVFYKGKLVILTDKATGRSVKAEADHELANLIFRQLPPETSWLNNNLAWHRDYSFLPNSAKVLANGPMRYVYCAYGTIVGQPATVTYTMDKDAAGIEIDIETDFREEIEGLMMFSTAADADGDVYADVPFGTEKREFFEDFFADPVTGEKTYTAPQELDFPGQIYGRNWCSYGYNKVPLTLISRNCSVYYLQEKEARTMSLILIHTLPLKTRIDRWVAKCPTSMGGGGKNHYSFSLMMNEAIGKSTDIQQYHKSRIFRAASVKRLGNFDQTREKKEFSFLAAKEDNIIGTAFYREGEKLYARFFECNGDATQAHITLPQRITKARTVDFEGNELKFGAAYDAATKTMTVPFGKFQIVTIEME